MDRSAHGEFELTAVGQIVVIRFMGEWNLEGARAFFEAYKRLVEAQKWTRFGVLSDLRGFGGGTPDAVEFFETITRWASKHGQVGRALVLYTAYEEFLVEQIDKKGPTMPSRSFGDEADALTWLASLDLGLGPLSPR
jgi:hypothetical protein